MSLSLQRSEWFIGDLEHYAAWYDHEANWALAERYLRAIDSTLSRLANVPTLGHKTSFTNPELSGLRCLGAKRPFHKHLIFYRFDETTLYAERAVHGTRDLPRRPIQPPSSEFEK